MLRESFLLLFELREELPMVEEGLSLTFHSCFITLRGSSQTQQFSQISRGESLDHQNLHSQTMQTKTYEILINVFIMTISFLYKASWLQNG